MIYLVSYKMVLQKVGAWGLRPRQVWGWGCAAFGGGIPNPLLALPEWLATEAGKRIATAEAGIREVGQALATAEWHTANGGNRPSNRQGSVVQKTDRVL